MLDGIAQLGFQIVHVALAEGDPPVMDDVGAFLNVRHQHTVAVAHSLQQGEGHSLQVAGQNEQIGVAVQLIPQRAVHEVGEEDAVIAGGQSLQGVHVIAGVGHAARNDQLFVGLEPLEGFAQMVAALFRHQTAQKQQVGTVFQPEPFPDELRRGIRRAVDAVGDVVGLAVIGVAEIGLVAVVEHDDLVREPGTDLLAEVDVPGAEAALPLVPRPVQPMDRQDDPLAEQPGQPAESGRAFGVDMHDIVRAERRRKAGKKAGCNGRKPFFVQCGHMADANTAVFVQLLHFIFFSADVLAGTVETGDLMPLFDHPRGKLFNNDLDAALVGGDALVAEHCDPHDCPFLCLL